LLKPVTPCVIQYTDNFFPDAPLLASKIPRWSKDDPKRTRVPYNNGNEIWAGGEFPGKQKNENKVGHDAATAFASIIIAVLLIALFICVYTAGCMAALWAFLSVLTTPLIASGFIFSLLITILILYASGQFGHKAWGMLLAKEQKRWCAHAPFGEKERYEMNAWKKIWDWEKGGGPGDDGTLGRVEVMCVYGRWVSPVDNENGEPITAINCKKKTSMTWKSPGPWMPTSPSVICSHMWRHGFLSDGVYVADHGFGSKVGRGSLYHGYVTWASPLVRYVCTQATHVCSIRKADYYSTSFDHLQPDG
jgi:hypothetical protein